MHLYKYFHYQQRWRINSKLEIIFEFIIFIFFKFVYSVFFHRYRISDTRFMQPAKQILAVFPTETQVGDT